MQSMCTTSRIPNRELRGIEVPHSCVPPTSVANKDAGMSIAMVETGGDPGHERARHTYEKWVSSYSQSPEILQEARLCKC
jgi:hypothetical protein